jgi:leucyl-tRNA synthetase
MKNITRFLSWGGKNLKALRTFKVLSFIVAATIIGSGFFIATATVVAAAQNDELLQEKFAGTTTKKVIYVPGRILNFIVTD